MTIESSTINPFEYDAALNLPEKALVRWYIEDHNFARVLKSTRNVLINGHRGSGKSMMLIYNSLRFQKLRHNLKNDAFPPRHVGIYVPCNTPLTYRQDFELLPATQQVTLSEFYFAMAIAEAIARAFEQTDVGFHADDYSIVTEELKTVLTGVENSNPRSIFTQIRRNITRQLQNLQRSLQKGFEPDADYDAVSFYSFVAPILLALKQTSVFSNSHFSILIDDAHDLNIHQRKLLNSWLSYRDHSVFSFKVAIAGLRSYDLRTLSGGTILEGHDYLTVDLEQPFQNEESNYAKFANAVVQQRLQEIRLDDVSPEEFFPESDSFQRDIKRANSEARQSFLAKKGWSDVPIKELTPEQKKAITDHVYKYGRAKYFRERKSKANLPVYAGFDTLVHLSTGVIRNLLNPCYQMFDLVLSKGQTSPRLIPPDIQSEVVISKSDDVWEQIRRGLEYSVEGCTKEDADHLKNLFTALGHYFRERLELHESEPRVLTFTISRASPEDMRFLDKLFGIAQVAQLLYIRSGSSRTRGVREDYYTPNRILWPARGLDVHGQHGRASIPSTELVAVSRGRESRTLKTIDDDRDVGQLTLV